MGAIRGAKAFTGRNKILKMEGGYHGSHDAAEISVGPKVEDAGPSQAPESLPEGKGIFRGIMADIVVAPLLNRGIFTAPRSFACISTPMRDAEVDAAIRAFGEMIVEIQPLLVLP